MAIHCVKSAQTRSYFWSLFSCIQSECRKIRSINNFVFGHFSRSHCFVICFFCLMITKLRQLNGWNCSRHRENMLNRLNSLYSTYSYGKVLRMNQVDTWFSRVFPILNMHTAPRDCNVWINKNKANGWLLKTIAEY